MALFMNRMRRIEWYRHNRKAGQPVNAAHLVSDQVDGDEELRQFVKRLGLNPQHIQHAGTHRAFYQLLGWGWVNRAREAGVTLLLDDAKFKAIFTSKLERGAPAK